MVAAARAAHEANRLLCLAMGDNSQTSWENAPDWQKNSALTGVSSVISHPSITAEQLHESWLDSKRADGWKYGPVKDETLKEHPCFIPYAELPAKQRLKDEMFGMIVRAVLNI
jgi:hypothetical protein